MLHLVSRSNRHRPRRSLAVALGLGLALAALPALGSAQASTPSLRTGPISLLAADPPTTLPSGRTTYRTINDYNAEMIDLAADNPALVKHFVLPHKTRMGRSVYGVEVTNDVNVDDGKPVMFMMGMHHGNEWPSGEHTLEFAYDLVNNAKAGDPEISDLLDRVRVIFVPVVNVDGFIRNRRTGCGISPECVSNQGVDVNRNYPFGWGANIASNFVTRGPGPGSEPEIKNVMDVTTSHQVTTLITNHTSGHTVLRAPFEKAAGDAPDEVYYNEFSNAITDVNGYTGMQSGYDYETTGETNDWSYYATGGFGFTFEIMKTQSTNGTFPAVIEDYNGTGQFDGFSNRESFMVVLRRTADEAAHSRITGQAPEGAVLKITKDFDLYTSPIKNADTTVSPPQAIPTHLSSTMTVPAGGAFTWDVNPSVRPQPGYTKDGVVATAPGKFLQEAWTLTCSSPSGKVLDTVAVTVARGQSESVALPNCVEQGKMPVGFGAVSVDRNEYGQSRVLTIPITQAGASGTVEVRENGRLLGKAPIRNAAASLSLGGRVLVPGMHRLDLTYSGDTDNQRASGAATIAISKASSQTKVKVKPKRIKANKTRAKLKVKIAAAGVKPGGKLRIKVAGQKARNVRLSNGRAVVTLGKFKHQGKYRVQIRYAGDRFTAATAATIRIRVR